MANNNLGLMRHSAWIKASELHLQHEECKQLPLELCRLKSLFPNGLQRGSITEITGTRSAGKTSLSLYILSESISKGETCAYIDLNNRFSPAVLLQNGVSPSHLSWVQCNGNTEHALRSADLLLHAGGFGIVLLDLCEAQSKTLNRIPPSYWFRFQRAIEATSTILLVCCEQQLARSCSRHSVTVTMGKFNWKGVPPFSFLSALELTAQVNKPAQSKVTVIRPEPISIKTCLVDSEVF